MDLDEGGTRAGRGRAGGGRASGGRTSGRGTSRAGGSRRRGTELESALLDAAWQELVERGYGALTFDAVAHRAGTSRPVIYRRWSTKPEIVRAALEHTLRRSPTQAPDTGSLRGDVTALLRDMDARRVGSWTLAVYYLGGYFQETGTSPADLRASVIGDAPTAIDVILRRAADRGEIELDRLSPRLRTLAFDLFRHEALMTLGHVPDHVVEEIVDDIYLPLVTVGVTGTS